MSDWLQKNLLFKSVRYQILLMLSRSNLKNLHWRKERKRPNKSIILRRRRKNIFPKSEFNFGYFWQFKKKRKKRGLNFFREWSFGFNEFQIWRLFGKKIVGKKFKSRKVWRRNYFCYLIDLRWTKLFPRFQQLKKMSNFYFRKQSLISISKNRFSRPDMFLHLLRICFPTELLLRSSVLYLLLSSPILHDLFIKHRYRDLRVRCRSMAKNSFNTMLYVLAKMSGSQKQA